MAIQVYEVTKDGEGNPLSILSRQFISFSYGGKNIEDFDLVAYFSNDRLSKNVYSVFEDITTNQAELDGQLFWGSHYKPNELNFTLATDGITSKKLDEFKTWFIPGVERELILSENHNRAIRARVSSAPSMSLLPFEEEIEVEVGGQKTTTSISLYKGEITLSFIMDEPHWYAITDCYSGDLTQEMAKSIYEDGIPHMTTLDKSKRVLLSGNKVFKNNTLTVNAGQALSSEENLFLYYCGSAPSNTIISFNTLLVFNDIQEISYNLERDDLKPYIRIENQWFYLSLPDVALAYNDALKIVREYEEMDAIYLRKQLRDNLYNYYVRAYAVGIVDKNKTSQGSLPTDFKKLFENEMKKFFSDMNISFSFNSKTGEATYSYINDSVIVENAGNCVKSNYLIIEPFVDNYQIITTNFSAINDLKIDYRYMYL